MRINNVFAGRPQYYDRNPSIIGSMFFVSTNIAPHASVNRYTYTVPAGRKAIIGSHGQQAIRNTAPTTSGKVVVGVNTSDGSLSETAMNNNVVGTVAGFEGSIGVFLLAGKIWQGQTGDASTGGTIDYDLQSNIMEFDA